MKVKKLTEYCSITCNPDWFKSLAINTGYVGRPDTTGYLIPAPVCDAASNALDYLTDALGNACDGCEWKMSRHINEETGKVSCMQKPECVIARGYDALHKYQEVTKDETK